MDENTSTTALLERHIELLRGKLAQLDEERTLVHREIQTAENALSSILVTRKDCFYRKEDTLREKILFCLNKRETILSISAITDMLLKIDRDLGNSVNDFSQSVSLQITKMIEDEQIIQYKLPQMKNLHYALKDWTDDIGEIRERYFG